jgi:hypothetical protein
MTQGPNSPLEDGTYPCAATLTIVNGKAVITLHTDFGLPGGTSIGLAKQPEGATISVHAPDGTVLFNGHSII